MIITRLSTHAERQAQRRGISARTLDLVLNHSDRSQKRSGQARALWVSPKARARLVWLGFPAAEVDRASGVRLIVHTADDVVMTVEHATARRAWA